MVSWLSCFGGPPDGGRHILLNGPLYVRRTGDRCLSPSEKASNRVLRPSPKFEVGALEPGMWLTK